MTTDSLALDFKSATLYAIRVVLHSADLKQLVAALEQRMADAGSFFENEPVVIDASRVADPIDWPALLAALREHNLPSIGVVAEGANLAAAKTAGLAPVELSTPVSRPAPAVEVAPANHVATPVPAVAASALETKPTPAPAATTTEDTATATQAKAASASQTEHAAPSTAMVITRPLRSGQRVYARHTDLVVIGMVSQGAEVIADGNVHVYGPLRGKAMAGARGDTSARIFTTQLDAELLAIAGVYRVVEAKLDSSLHNQPALVSLDGETLRVDALKK
ncbi:septum site-determining protein MinC [Bordetella sp. 15P40C-2]|uniref:septum site-determining protein MinC n=1 Tax=Bordetella sp. 15P40C-2 TaxID=2572246 RepID=UPI001322E2B0|nr:septum site-determining protein MinC [Bordetella sp. 15P40C-2]MVW73487.1 septum site-determining protein MinC [Bordetella sp. 15P40C-2]